MHALFLVMTCPLIKVRRYSNIDVHVEYLPERQNNLPSKDSSEVCYHHWEFVANNEKSRDEAFLKCKKCGKIMAAASGG
jgi:hypothetical protein